MVWKWKIESIKRTRDYCSILFHIVMTYCSMRRGCLVSRVPKVVSQTTGDLDSWPLSRTYLNHNYNER